MQERAIKLARYKVSVADVCANGIEVAQGSEVRLEVHRSGTMSIVQIMQSQNMFAALT